MRSDQVGIYVEAVDPGSVAEQAGFKLGMVLMEADGIPIAEVAKWKSIILNAKAAQQDGIIVLVRHKDGRETMMVLPLQTELNLNSGWGPKEKSNENISRRG
jgi:S1-C subfamily serine protease